MGQLSRCAKRRAVRLWAYRSPARRLSSPSASCSQASLVRCSKHMHDDSRKSGASNSDSTSPIIRSRRVVPSSASRRSATHRYSVSTGSGNNVPSSIRSVLTRAPHSAPSSVLNGGAIAPRSAECVQSNDSASEVVEVDNNRKSVFDDDPCDESGGGSPNMGSNDFGAGLVSTVFYEYDATKVLTRIGGLKGIEEGPSGAILLVIRWRTSLFARNSNSFVRVGLNCNHVSRVS